jgi:hypothetical protein
MLRGRAGLKVTWVKSNTAPGSYRRHSTALTRWQQGLLEVVLIPQKFYPIISRHKRRRHFFVFSTSQGNFSDFQQFSSIPHFIINAGLTGGGWRRMCVSFKSVTMPRENNSQLSRFGTYYFLGHVGLVVTKLLGQDVTVLHLAPCYNLPPVTTDPNRIKHVLLQPAPCYKLPQLLLTPMDLCKDCYSWTVFL